MAGTKTFSFKDHRQFFNLVRLFFAAAAVLDCIMETLRAHPMPSAYGEPSRTV